MGYRSLRHSLDLGLDLGLRLGLGRLLSLGRGPGHRRRLPPSGVGGHLFDFVDGEGGFLSSPVVRVGDRVWQGREGVKLDLVVPSEVAGCYSQGGACG